MDSADEPKEEPNEDPFPIHKAIVDLCDTLADVLESIVVKLLSASVPQVAAADTKA